jgi:hypothetical protein
LDASTGTERAELVEGDGSQANRRHLSYCQLLLSIALIVEKSVLFQFYPILMLQQKMQQLLVYYLKEKILSQDNLSSQMSCAAHDYTR